MKKEIVITAATVEEAVRKGCEELGCPVESAEYEVLVQPKKGFLGIGSTDAKVKIQYASDPSAVALEFAKSLVKNMELDAEVTSGVNENGEFKIDIDGDDAGILIGHHGDTLDALQYLCNLAANKKESNEDDREYTRIVVDIAGYRAKREETLRNLARRTADKVLKYKRNLSLEPMPSHERRIIHSEIQKIDGVTTTSIGTEANRRVVVILEKSK